jgi:hypothetical protein
MRELNATLDIVHTGALDAALKAAVPGKVIGVSTYGPGRPISIWVQDSTSPAEEAALTAVVAAHDPVSLTVDKPLITADGSDTATVTVSTPKPGAASVSLVIAGGVVPVTLVNGVGTVTITSVDPAAIPISIQNAANRSTDQVVIIAK